MSSVKGVASHPSHKRYLWRDADYDAMNIYSNTVDWSNVICQNPGVEQMWDAFVCILWNAIDMFVPSRKACSNHNTGHRSRPIPLKLRKCMADKRRIWRQLKLRPKDLQLRGRYRELVCSWRKLVRDRDIYEEERIIEADNLGEFYRFVNKRISNKSSIGAIVEDCGDVLTENIDKANAFNKYFASVGVVDDGVTPCVDNVPLGSILDSICISDSDVLHSIRRLKCNLSSGPDNIPPMLIKKLCSSLCKPLSLLFNQFISVGFVPDDWRKAVVVPVFKKGAAGLLSNYRPISLTYVLSKVMERIVSRKVCNHLRLNNILSPDQHGFLSKRSTCTNLLKCFNDWSLSIQSREQTTVIYVDFSKAFDVVSHAKLFTRLHSYRATVFVTVYYFGSKVSSVIAKCVPRLDQSCLILLNWLVVLCKVVV